MSNQFEWQIEEAETGTGPPRRRSRQTKVARWLLALLVSGLLMYAVWWLVQRQLNLIDADLQRSVQELLDLEQRAVLTGDGELFLSLQASDPAWRAAQLLPYNHAPVRAGQTVEAIEASGGAVQAEVTWREGDSRWRRFVFFNRQGESLTHGPAPDAYWGRRRQQTYEWGSLSYYAVDAAWAPAIAAFVDETVVELCSADCIADSLPFTLIIAPDYATTAVPRQIRQPSPRLLALDEAGQPAPLFWEQLRGQLEAQLTPATIRFAVPQISRSRYQLAAQAFATVHPHIHVEIVTLESEQATSESDVELFANIDGAYLRPTESLLAAGLVRDLTDFVYSDPDFDQGDFYDQIWRGAWWLERIWLVPHGAGMKLLYYDRLSYPNEPASDWTWELFTGELDRVENPAGDGARTWRFLDTGLDSLFAYAYNDAGDCRTVPDPACNRPLASEHVAAAFTWYRERIVQEQMPDVTILSAEERQFLPFRLTSSQRQVTFWVDDPVNYEHHALLAPVRVASFPGTETDVGVTPLWVSGGVISQSSKRPLAVWHWLNFLTYESIDRQLRLVPARPSVGRVTNFWGRLPIELRTVMQEAFPFARPVTFAEESRLVWEQVTAVVNGDLTPEQAAQSPPRLRWFDVRGAEAGE